MTTETAPPESASEESYRDRALAGPTPDNPSLSLKTRLKRAAFFDQRERQVAEGTAEPVPHEAGLPEAGIEEGFDLPPEEEDSSQERPPA